MKSSEQISKLPIRCEFRSLGYTEDEISALRSYLADIGVLQARRQAVPAAGASYDISFVIEWAGLTVLSGVIGNSAYEWIKMLAERLSKFYRRKQKQRSGFPPDISCVEFRFNDMDLRIHGVDFDNAGDDNCLSLATLVRLSDIISVVLRHVRTDPLCSEDVQALDVYEPHPTLTSDDDCGLLFTRPWRVESFVQCFYSDYFPHERRLVDSPQSPRDE